MAKLFGTDGVRGVANKELTPEVAYQLGRAGGYVLAKGNSPKILLAKDGRLSGDMLEAALAAGLCSIGAQVHCAGIMPTPAVAYIVREYGFDAGVMISASHNEMADNGIKFFNRQGLKLPDELEAEIEKLINENLDELPRPIGENVGKIAQYPKAIKDYAEFLLSIVDLDLRGIKIAVDCANGATYKIAPYLLTKLGAIVYPLHCLPNGININKDCGSTHMQSLQAHVKKHGADVGLAFDGDGDRMLAVCDKGNIIDGDMLMAICGLDMYENGELANNTIVATVMSNQGFECFCNENGITMHRTDVGDRYVLEKMLAEKHSLGGEQSGHIIFLQHTTTGDGLLTALKLLSVMARKNKPLSELASVMEIFPQVLENATVPNARKAEMATCKEIIDCQAQIEAEMNGEGRILVRPSGTEPVVRVMLEGRDKGQIGEWARRLVGVIEGCLG